MNQMNLRPPTVATYIFVQTICVSLIIFPKPIRVDALLTGKWLRFSRWSCLRRVEWQPQGCAYN